MPNKIIMPNIIHMLLSRKNDGKMMGTYSRVLELFISDYSIFGYNER